MKTIESKYIAVNKRINVASVNANRKDQPHLLAVSKKHSAEKIEFMQQLGQADFGENYVQEGVDKICQLKSLPITWHFIGPIQSNKAKLIAEYFDWVQSVDRMKVMVKLNDCRPKNMAPLQVLLQFKVGNEATKSGASLPVIRQLAEAITAMKQLDFRGLMCIPPPSQAMEEQLKYFAEARQLYEKLAKKYSSVDTLSMGMSNDLEAAITSGSTMVRIGTDLFGERIG